MEGSRLAGQSSLGQTRQVAPISVARGRVDTFPEFNGTASIVACINGALLYDGLETGSATAKNSNSTSERPASAILPCEICPTLLNPSKSGSNAHGASKRGMVKPFVGLRNNRLPVRSQTTKPAFKSVNEPKRRKMVDTETAKCVANKIGSKPTSLSLCCRSFKPTSLASSLSC